MSCGAVGAYSSSTNNTSLAAKFLSIKRGRHAYCHSCYLAALATALLPLLRHALLWRVLEPPTTASALALWPGDGTARNCFSGTAAISLARHLIKTVVHVHLPGTIATLASRLSSGMPGARLEHAARHPCNIGT